MKSKPLLVLFVVCFSLFLIIGYRASKAVFSEDAPARSSLLKTTGPVLLEEEDQGQPLGDPFTLLILVDDLSSPDPALDGVWLNRSTDGGQGSLFFPIFPSQAEDGDKRDLNLRGAFWLEESLQPSQQFQTILQDRNLSWNQIIILDHFVLGEIGSILAEINPDYQPLNSVGLAGLSYTVENRLVVQGNQALFINDLCSQLPVPAHSELLQRFLEGFAGHMLLIETTPLAVTQSWSQTNYCLFPTLTLPNH